MIHVFYTQNQQHSTIALCLLCLSSTHRSHLPKHNLPKHNLPKHNLPKHNIHHQQTHTMPIHLMMHCIIPRSSPPLPACTIAASTSRCLPPTILHQCMMKNPQVHHYYHVHMIPNHLTHHMPPRPTPHITQKHPATQNHPATQKHQVGLHCSIIHQSLNLHHNQVISNKMVVVGCIQVVPQWVVSQWKTVHRVMAEGCVMHMKACQQE